LLHTVRFIAFVLHWTVNSLSVCRELVKVVAEVVVVVAAAVINGLVAVAAVEDIEEADRRRVDATLEMHGPAVVAVVVEATTVVERMDLPM
jgi:hypothetical protein